LPVSYGTAIATGGAAPVTVFCAPESGSTFNPGATTVTCTATDAKNTAKTCSLTVTVTVPSMLALTQFRAFGDSITAGEILAEGDAFGFRALKVDQALAYPLDLSNLLKGRYTAQPQLSVFNDGASGETTTCGLSRLKGSLAPGCVTGPIRAAPTYQVLLLMEGSNDIFDESSIKPALQNIDSMVAYAQASGLRVFLASIPPQGPVTNGCPTRNGGMPFVPTYNDGLVGVAASRGATFVDVYSALNADLPDNIDCDGLHPTVTGYTVIANAFYQRITQTLEAKSIATLPTSVAQTVQRPARVRR